MSLKDLDISEQKFMLKEEYAELISQIPENNREQFQQWLIDEKGYEIEGVNSGFNLGDAAKNYGPDVARQAMAFVNMARETNPLQENMKVFHLRLKEYEQGIETLEI